jgi:glycosyltransferase involved in cell wall biosynthesis
MAEPRIAIVHDWLVSPGGAEKVVYQLHQMYPKAPIYTAAFDPDKFPEYAGAEVYPTWLDLIPLAKTKHQLFSIPRGLAFLTLNLSQYDIVISSCSAESKYVHTGKHTLHICYCHTPIRYYWSDYDWYLQHPPFGKLNGLAKAVLPAIIGALRWMDFRGAQGVDSYVANSRFVQSRIERYYKRPSTVIYPPVGVERFALSQQHGDYYVIVGRQVAYKRLDLAIDAFNTLGLPLKISGTGEEINVQRPRAGANIEFLGRVPDDQLGALLGGAKAFIFPGVEDFGIAPVEAMAAGTPVIAYAEGGALESVEEGVSGTLFNQQSPQALVEAVQRFQTMTFDPQAVRAKAEQFSERVFRDTMSTYVAQEWARFASKRPQFDESAVSADATVQ